MTPQINIAHETPHDVGDAQTPCTDKLEELTTPPKRKVLSTKTKTNMIEQERTPILVIGVSLDKPANHNPPPIENEKEPFLSAKNA